jgi:hypothetical protein
MSPLDQLTNTSQVSAPLPESQAAHLTEGLGRLVGGQVYAASIVGVNGRLFGLVRRKGRKRLLLVQRPGAAAPTIDPVERVNGDLDGEDVAILLCETNAEAARLVRECLPFTRPQTLGIKRSFGAGDRLGLAGPGHIRACRVYGKGIAPVLAQQSARELMRTLRTPQDVIDAATWAVIQEGYREPWGADADHLKTPKDVDSYAAAGFTMFTIDPGDQVDDKVDFDDNAALTVKYDALPWHALETTGEAMWHAYVGITYELGDDVNLVSDTPHDLMRAACKYGRAIAHAASMARHVAEVMRDRPYEIEVSVDETTSHTRVFEHFFVANELKRLGVPNLVSLAPRFVGEFEKGIDYKGDGDRFESAVRRHAVVARHCGPYKLSVHSGSDKFKIYPIIARQAGDLVHVKTAGTSYLEALRVIGRVDPDLFREIYAFAYGRYEQDRASYHVSAQLKGVPKPDGVTAQQMPDLLDRDDTRQVLHVTFGSVLTMKTPEGGWQFRDRLLATLDANEEAYYEALVAHIGRHLAPFAVD